MSRDVRSFRVDEGLWEWAKAYSEKEFHRPISWLLTEMLEAAQEGRMKIEPRPGPNAYPADELILDEKKG